MRSSPSRITSSGPRRRQRMRERYASRSIIGRGVARPPCAGCRPSLAASSDAGARRVWSFCRPSCVGASIGAGPCRSVPEGVVVPLADPLKRCAIERGGSSVTAQLCNIAGRLSRSRYRLCSPCDAGAPGGRVVPTHRRVVPRREVRRHPPRAPARRGPEAPAGSHDARPFPSGQFPEPTADREPGRCTGSWRARSGRRCRADPELRDTRTQHRSRR